MKKVVIVHFGEIGLKGANKQNFVNKLISSVKKKLEKKFRTCFDVKEILKRVLFHMPDGVSESDVSDILQSVFGIKNFQFV